MKIMRANYDKPHRCPMWSGPAFKGSDGECASGSFAKEFYIERYWYNKDPYWRFHKCRTCGTVVLPVYLQNLDPSWWKHKIKWKWRDFTYELRLRWEDWKYYRELDKQDKGKVG